LSASVHSAKSLGYSIETLVGQPVVNLIEASERPQLQTELLAAQFDPPLTKGGQILTFIGQNGSRILQWVNLQVLQGPDQQKFLLLIGSPQPESTWSQQAGWANLLRNMQQLNADLEQQVQAHTAQLQLAFDFEATLKRITDKVRDGLDEAQILQTAVQELAEAIGVQSCNVAMYDSEQCTSTIHYEYTNTLSPYQGRVVHLNASVELYDQLLRGHTFQFCSLTPNPVRGRVAMLACPILDDQGVLGDLWLVNQPDYGFSDQDWRLVQQVANQCAIAIRQARLFQEAQAQVQELERLNHLKDDFLSTVSHELRTPMTNIKIATQMLGLALQQIGILGNEANSRVNQYFRILQVECEREINLINDLLDLSRLDAELATLELSPIDLPSWVRTIAQPFAERAQNQQQQFRIEIPPPLPPVLSDPSHLTRILVELLNNACKYTPAGETITVSADITSPGPAEPPPAQSLLHLQVTNSGVEIPPSEMDQIFAKFYRIPNNDPWQHGGTGLGLALVKKLTEHLGGTIQVESGAGQTCFRLDLPLREIGPL
jgi:signal transduction histidine kinase